MADRFVDLTSDTDSDDDEIYAAVDTVMASVAPQITRQAKGVKRRSQKPRSQKPRPQKAPLPPPVPAPPSGSHFKTQNTARAQQQPKRRNTPTVRRIAPTLVDSDSDSGTETEEEDDEVDQGAHALRQRGEQAYRHAKATGARKAAKAAVPKGRRVKAPPPVNDAYDAYDSDDDWLVDDSDESGEHSNRVTDHVNYYVSKMLSPSNSLRKVRPAPINSPDIPDDEFEAMSKCVWERRQKKYQERQRSLKRIAPAPVNVDE
jgi:hypothetical protein